MNDGYDLGDDDMEFLNEVIAEWFNQMNSSRNNIHAGILHLMKADNIEKVRELMLNIEIYNSPETANASEMENAQVEVGWLTDDFLRGVLAGFIVLLDHENYVAKSPEELAGLAYLHIAEIIHERTGVRP
jgi:hypothetical protein